MLLLVTIGLVLVGAVSLVIGFVTNSLGPIYLSIGCSLVAGVVLVIFSRMSKRREATPSTTFAPAPSPGSWSPAPPPAAPAPAPAPSSYAPPPRPAASEAKPAAASGTASPTAAYSGVADGFPIEGYDALRVSQILPQLDELDLDELDQVRAREEEGKGRTTVLRRIDALMDELEADGAGAPVAVSPAPAGEGGADDDDFFEEDDDELAGEMLGDDVGDDELVGDEEPPTAVIATPGSAPGDVPIPGYDELTVAEILPLLDDLSDEELDAVADHEERTKNRAAILDAIDDMFEPLEPAGAAAGATPMAPPASPRPASSGAKKAPPAKAPVKKSPVKKVAAKKAPAKKTAAKKTAAKKTAKAPARATKRS